MDNVSDFSAEMMDVTPIMATNWLLKNAPNNRKLKRETVKQYAEDMSAGRWNTGSCEPIVFNKNGVLENGQHRLAAICRSGKTMQMFVVFGAEEAIETYDRGVPRSISDAMRVRNNLRSGLASTIHIGTARGVLIDLGYAKPSDAAVEDMLLTYGEVIDSCVAAARQKTDGYSICRKTPIVKILFYARLVGLADEPTIYRFCKVANSGFSELPGDSSAILLRNQIIQPTRMIDSHYRSLWKESGVQSKLTALALYDFVKQNGRTRRYKITDLQMPRWVEVAIKMVADQASAKHSS